MRGSAIHLENVSPGGAAQEGPSPRTQITGASIAISAHCSTGLSEGGGGRVKGGQVPRVDLNREAAHPVARPPTTGEFANSATNAGPIACAARHRVGACSTRPASRQTWMDAVLHIISEPCGPTTSNAACIAS